MSTRYEYPREPSSYYPPPRRASTAPSSRYSSRYDYAPSRYYDDEPDYDDYYPRRRSRNYPRSAYNDYDDDYDHDYEYGDGDYPKDDKHANCEGGTCKAIEKEYGGFGWTEAFALAAMGGLALFNFDKAYDKHKRKSEQRRKDRELDESKSRSRSEREGGGKSRSRSDARVYDSELDDDEYDRRKERQRRRRAKSRSSRSRGYKDEAARGESW